MRLPEGRHRHLPGTLAYPLGRLVAALDHLGRGTPTLSQGAHHMALAVIVDAHMQLGARRPVELGQSVQHSNT